MTTIFEYLDKKDAIQAQIVNKYFYNWLLPRAGGVSIKMPRLNLVFESQRKVISIGMWQDNRRECQSVTVLKIGENEGEISPSKLGFSEVYFQYFVPIGERTFAAFPLEQEAILKKGFLVSFDHKWKYQESKPLPDLDENTMRPTACLLHANDRTKKSLLMLGGRQDRSSQIYSFQENKW